MTLPKKLKLNNFPSQKFLGLQHNSLPCWWQMLTVDKSEQLFLKLVGTLGLTGGMLLGSVLPALSQNIFYWEADPNLPPGYTPSGGANWNVDDLSNTYVNVAGSGIDINVQLLDPANQNLDSGNTGTLNVATETNSSVFGGAGRLTLGMTSDNSSQEVSLVFTFSQPVLLQNFLLGDIDSDGRSPVAQGFQDEAVFSAQDQNGNNVPVTLSRPPGFSNSNSNFSISGQTAVAIYESNVNRDVGATNQAGHVLGNPQAAITQIRIDYSNGPDDDGVSNDHAMMVGLEGGLFQFEPAPLDFSDAPADGSTPPNGNGTTGYGEASHIIVNGIRLGTNIDAETSAQSTAAADGDDNDSDGNDDDGVTIPSLIIGETATITADVAGAGGYLQGWIDWNSDGDFTDAGEQIALDVQDNGTGDTDNTTGNISFDVNVPAGAVASTDTFARFRWSTTPGLDTTTAANDGEVEDYQIAIAESINPPSSLGDFCYLVADGQGSTANDLLTTLDRNTGSEGAITVGSAGTGTTTIEAIAYNPISGVLYAGDAGRFGALNLNTGVFSQIGSTNYGDIDGLAIDPFSGDIFASTRRSGLDRLYKINPSTGAIIPGAFAGGANFVEIAAVNGLQDIDDITVSPTTGEIFGVANNGGNTDVVVKIDRLDGSTTLVGTPGVSDLEGFSSFQSGSTFSATTGNNSSNGNGNKFFSINSNTGTATFEHDLGIDIGNGTTTDYEAVDCSVYPPNTLSGKVFIDPNRDGSFNGSDTATENVTVRLFRDLNNDGVLDNNDDINNDGVLDDGDILATRETNANGDYSFVINATGAFIVNLDLADLPSEANLTTSGGNNIATADFGTASGTTIGDRNFGYVTLDYGDAAVSYDDTADNNNAIDANDSPANHVISSNLHLGAIAGDGEISPQNSPGADGDDSANDDEDAFATLPNVSLVGNYSLDVPLVNNLGSATLHGWIDFNQNGKFETEEYQSAVVNNNDTNANLTWTVPNGTIPGNTQARLRLTSDTLTDDSNTAAIDERSVGEALDGEVEDYPIAISAPIYDYGDAPDTAVGTGTGNYQTTAADNGAAQVVINAAGQILSIGDAVDTDDGIAQNDDATADDNLDSADDEDGLSSFPTITNEASQSFTVAVPVRNSVPLVDAFLVGYIDFNKDGDFEDDNEQSNTATISPNASGDAQTVNLTFTTPGGMTPGTTFARLRLGQVQATAEQATGAAASTDNGEIEDYQITITPTPPLSNNSTVCISPSSLISPASNLLNSANYSLDSALQNQVPLSFYNDTMEFNASLNGTSNWAGGIQVREDASFGDHIFVQPQNTANYRTSGNNATYVFSFPTSITNFSMITGGLNFADGTTISASYQGNPVQITAANFSNLSTGMSLIDSDGDGQSDTVLSSNTGGGTEVTNNIYTLSIADPIDTLTVLSGKDDNFTSTATIGFSLIGYCAALDYGDAPASYDDTAGGGTIDLDDEPAAHGINNTLYLGNTAADAETAPQSSTAADGDDSTTGGTDDEDGISSFPALSEDSTSYSLTTTVNNTSGSAANVYAWIDFDGDGEFDEDERATVASDSITLDGNGRVPNGASGTVQLNWDLNNSSPNVTVGDSYLRVRITQSDLDLNTNETTGRDDASVGLAVDGEVEDYEIAIASASLCPAARADLWFANDESGSVNANEFDDALDFIYQISDSFIFDDVTKMKAGIIGWASAQPQTNPNNIIIPITDSFGDPDDSGLISDSSINVDGDNQGVRELYTSRQDFSGNTRLDLATNYLASLINSGNGRRAATPQVAIIMTDAFNFQITGNGGGSAWVTAANTLKNAGADGTSIVLVLIDAAAQAYNSSSNSPGDVKDIVDQVVGNGRLLIVPSYSEAADATRGYVDLVSQAICDSTTPTASDPEILLVKRITAINPGQPNEIQFNDFIDDPNTTDDNNSLWPDSDEDPSSSSNLYLRGVIDGGRVKPGDEVEYTIYFLSSGDEDARDVQICDVVPDHLTYVKDGYGQEIGIAFGFDPTMAPTSPNRTLTNLLNDDEGDFYGADTAPPANLCKKVDQNNDLVTVDENNNDNGAIVVQPAPLLPAAVSPGQPANSYGFIRFRGRVK